MKKNILILILISATCFIIIYGIEVIRKKEKSGFERKIVEPGIILSNSFERNNKQFTFIGEDLNHDFLAYSYSDRKIYKVSDKNLIPVAFNIPDGYNMFKKNVYATSRFNTLFLNNQNEFAVINENTRKKITSPQIKYDLSQAISNNSIVARSYKIAHGNRVRELKKIVFRDSASILKRFTLPKQIDGFYCTDGRLYYDINLQKIFYMFFYRGEILELDTNLNLISKIKTIDTVKRAQIKIRTLNEKINGNYAKHSVQTKIDNIVNYAITTNDKKIYVYSLLEAENDDKKQFSNGLPIDVYSIDSGKYLYSFYLPKFNNEKISQFRIRGNTILTITRNRILIYKLKSLV